MQPYHTNSLYASNVIEIADSSFNSTQSLPHATSVLAMHPPDPFSDAIYKKRKIERACDACRRRKTKCDGPRMPDNTCTNCIQNRKTCSYVESSKPRGPPKAYITSLEDRLEKMQALLKRLRPEADFSEELGPLVIRDSWKTDPEPPRVSPPLEKSTSPSASSVRHKGSPSGRSRSNALPSSRSTRTLRSDTDLSSDGYTSSDSEEVGELSLSRGMKRLTIRGLEPTQDHRPITDNQVRFHGKSSCFKLIEPTRKLRDEHVNRLTGGEERSCSSRDSTPIDAAALRRPEFWTTPPWEFAFEGYQNRLEDLSSSLAEDFPPHDLADSLIKLFFENVNPFLPLFHRPTFERQWRDGLQHKDAWFGCLCLSMFAVASRWSDDPRVLDDGRYDVPQAERPIATYKWQRAGWRFFNAAVDVHRGSLSLFHPAGLFEVQTMALLGMFLRGTAFHPVAWLFISIGLRKAQDVGAHRKKIYGDKTSIEGELWKRAFWVLVLLDRIASAALGRPCCSGEEDFDAELPLEVDDEYWEPENQEGAFQQPPGKPSKIAAFNSCLKLTKILAYAMRTIYALDRSKLLFSAARPQWQEVLAQLNHAMTEWVDSVPKHLRWSPHIEDPLFSDQSATLYITYYVIQIMIYRPFLPQSLHSVMNIMPRSNMPIPCIAVCVNAGKCVARILKAQITRGFSNIPTLILGSHVCAAILLMNFWDLKWQERNQMRRDGFEDIKSPLALAMAELLEEISVFIEALEAVKPRWRNAEIYLNDLSSSLPHNLGGYEPTFSNNDPLSRHHPPHAASLDYTIFGDYRNPPPAHRIAPSLPIDTYTFDTQVEPSEPNAYFFEVPHITRYPVPSTLPLPSSPSCARDQSMSTATTTFHSQCGYDQPGMTAELGDRRSSTSSFRSRPDSLFDERAVDKTMDPSICRQYAMDNCASYNAAVSVPTHPSVGGNFAPYRTIPGWASDWNHSPAGASRRSSENPTIQPSCLSQNRATRNSLGQLFPFPGR
ncbi:fungal-specific transcription factor domain-containing protein [Boletus edulis]|nr:fungal-specific transcription factor domain-containing protein [Boletus edulis]